jgi:hypothetical protein
MGELLPDVGVRRLNDGDLGGLCIPFEVNTEEDEEEDGPDGHVNSEDEGKSSSNDLM